MYTSVYHRYSKKGGSGLSCNPSPALGRLSSLSMGSLPGQTGRKAPVSRGWLGRRRFCPYSSFQNMPRSPRHLITGFPDCAMFPTQISSCHLILQVECEIVDEAASGGRPDYPVGQAQGAPDLHPSLNTGGGRREREERSDPSSHTPPIPHWTLGVPLGHSSLNTPPGQTGAGQSAKLEFLQWKKEGKTGASIPETHHFLALLHCLPF